jgi:hypothetical protein
MTEEAPKKKGAGRPRGSINKNSQKSIKKLMELSCDPLVEMHSIAVEARKQGDLHLAGGMYKELAQYFAPKLRSVSIETDSDNPPIFQMQWLDDQSSE